MLIVMAILLTAILMPIIMIIIIIIIDEYFMVWKILLTQIINFGGLTKKDPGFSECLNRGILEQAK